MADAVTTKHTCMTICDLKEYAGEHNGWDRTRLHPASHQIIVRSADGTERKLDVAQLELFLTYAEQHPNMGSALDAVAHAIPQQLRSVA